MTSAHMDLYRRAARAATGLGARLLDKERPTWRKEIDPGVLDCSRGQLCVLGQVYGSYIDGLSVLGIGLIDAPLYGFDVPVERGTLSMDTAYELLTGAWRELLAG